MKWHIEQKKVSELKTYDKNPRVITKKGLADLKKSIGKFGIAEPIVVNADYTIIGGHARAKALKADDIVDVYVPDRKLDEQEYKELNVRLNKNIAGEWDFDILANEFDIDDLKEWGFDDRELNIAEIIDEISLPDGDKPGFQQITFTLTDEQTEQVKIALTIARKNDFTGTGNENSNGNAIALICELYNGNQS